ncbi:MAG: LON peptidase substrate-binding domain-containing protein [Planctomycetota bacterium]
MPTETKQYAASAPPDLGGAFPLLVLPEPTLFPGTDLRRSVTSPAARALVDALPAAASPFVVVATEEDLRSVARGIENGNAGPIAVLARVRSSMGHRSGNHSLALEGLERVRLVAVQAAGAFHTVSVARAPERAATDSGAQFDKLRAVGRAVIECMPELASAVGMVDAVPDPGRFCDLCAANLDLPANERATLLVALDVDERVRQLITFLTRKEQELRPAYAEIESQALQEPWPFEAGAEQRLRADVASQRLASTEAFDIRHLAEKGFVTWPRLIEPELIDALLADIRSIPKYPGHFVTTNHRNSQPFCYSEADFDAYESVFDPYVNFESVRAVCFHPKITRFLELVFDAPPLAFQQLLFQRSNGHPLHQDTAYVWVDKPMQMLATWIALEDVVQGRGELTYFEGSHRIPHFLFGDGSKRFNYLSDKPGPVAQHIKEQVAAKGCKKHDFLAKKGDVFVWAADLVHGSNKRTRPEVETRRSCVTHYCPMTTRPFWFRTLKEHRGLLQHGRASIASSHYRLPKGPGIVRPAFLLPEGPAPHAE